jgi:hypothetical protein
MADVRRLRTLNIAPGFERTLEYHKLYPTTWGAKQLAIAIGRLRMARVLPLPEDARVDLWGQTGGYHARLFSSELWLYYKFDDETLYLHAVHNHLSEM